MAPWENGEAKHSYNRPNKRRFDEIRNTIETLRHELFINDIVLKTEVEKRVYSDYDRELMEAELYKQRLAALTEASRSQIWRVQSGQLTSGDFHLDYDSWNPKRKRPNYKEETPSCDYLSQYAPANNWYDQTQMNNWTGYSQANSNNYNYNQVQPNRNKKRKNKSGPIVSMNRCKINKPATTKNATALLPTPKPSVGLLPTPNLAPKSTSAPIKNTVAPKTNAATAKPVATASKTNTAAKTIVSTVKPNVPVKQNVSTAKTNVSVKPVVSNGQTIKQNMSGIKPIPTIVSAPTPRPIRPILPLRPIKMETLNNIKANESSRNIPPLFSLDMSSIRLQFAPSDRIFIKSENYPSERLLGSNGTVTVKTENPDLMVDDLADHI